MELSERLVQVKNTAKPEEDFPSYSPDNIVFLLGDVVRPVGIILNHNDPTECYVLFPPAGPIQDNFNAVDPILGGDSYAVRFT